MAEHEPLNIEAKDDKAKDAQKRRGEDAQVASEPMDLQRLPSDKPVRPGRQRTGDPPSAKRS